MRLYMAGPIGGMPTLELARENFRSASGQLIDVGYEPVNPMEVAPRCGRKCSGPKDPNSDPNDFHSRSCYLRYDIIEMLECDGVALIPGWFNSPGANRERDIARHCGMPAQELEYWVEKAKEILG